MIGIIGAGAFGTALAVAQGRNGRDCVLWGRDVAGVAASRMSPRLPGVALPGTVAVSADLGALSACDLILLALPMQSLRAFLAQHRARLDGSRLVACCKGLDLATLQGPAALIAEACPGSAALILTGPSFASDIARQLSTALTLACTDDRIGQEVQARLSTPTLRLYRNTDVTGAELGGALKNVIAIACGVVIGAGLGDSARAALMTRGFAEMQRLAVRRGARPETLMGLSGFGDLVLTCTSDLSRNFRHGRALGAGAAFEAGATVEGVATARAALRLAAGAGVEMPVTAMLVALLDGRLGVDQAMRGLLARPLASEETGA